MKASDWAIREESCMSQEPVFTLVKPGPKGLTLEQTLALFTKLSGREATSADVAELKAKMAAREVSDVSDGMRR
jgi:hypothetical protein